MPIDVSTAAKNAVLVGIHLPTMTPQDLEGSLAELARLVTTLGYNVVGTLSQKRGSERDANVLGDGKLLELAKWTGGSGVVAPMVKRKKTKAELRQEQEEAEHLDPDDTQNVDIEEVDTTDTIETLSREEEPSAKADIVIFDCDLTPSQLRNVETATGVTVLDRTGVIIEIFSRHARTKAARLQVEIAKLTYVAPRLRETGGNDQQGGAGRAGESALELDRRKIRDRIKELKEELDAISTEHEIRRARRSQENTVALVGYTNAGKSSLMRAMTGSEVLVADKLFATLDTTIRPIYPETRPKVLVSDTVGFIKKLPHDLVASFKSTLDEAVHASLLLIVVDSADPSFRSQFKVTSDVLGEVEAQEVPKLLVFNKRDKLAMAEFDALKAEFPEAVFISTRNKEDIKMLREKIVEFFESDMLDEDLFVAYSLKGIIGEIRARMRVVAESYNEQGVILKVKSTKENLDFIKKKIQQESRQ